jgi:hypothetical protein
MIRATVITLQNLLASGIQVDPAYRPSPRFVKDPVLPVVFAIIQGFMELTSTESQGESVCDCLEWGVNGIQEELEGATNVER